MRAACVLGAILLARVRAFSTEIYLPKESTPAPHKRATPCARDAGGWPSVTFALGLQPCS